MFELWRVSKGVDGKVLKARATQGSIYTDYKSVLLLLDVFFFCLRSFHVVLSADVVIAIAELVMQIQRTKETG